MGSRPSSLSEAQILVVEDNPGDVRLMEDAFRDDVSKIRSTSSTMDEKHWTSFIAKKGTKTHHGRILSS